MMDHNISFYRKMWKIIPITPSYLERCEIDMIALLLAIGVSGLAFLG